DRQQEEDAEDVARQREEDRERGDQQTEGDRQHTEAELRAPYDLVLLARDVARVPAPATALARPSVAVAQVALLAALARDRDRRPAQDGTRRLAPEALAPPAAAGRAALLARRTTLAGRALAARAAAPAHPLSSPGRRCACARILAARPGRACRFRGQLVQGKKCTYLLKAAI